MGQYSEAQPSRTMPRANPRSGANDATLPPGSGSSVRPSAGEEASADARRRQPGETLERRDSVQATRSSATGKRDDRRLSPGASTLSGANESVERAPRWLPTGIVPEVAVEARPESDLARRGRLRRRTPGTLQRLQRAAAKRSEEQGATDGSTSEVQRVGVGSPTRRRPASKGLVGAAFGRFVPPACVEGEKNPMRGGCALWKGTARAAEKAADTFRLPRRRTVASRCAVELRRPTRVMR